MKHVCEMQKLGVTYRMRNFLAVSNSNSADYGRLSLHRLPGYSLLVYTLSCTDFYTKIFYETIGILFPILAIEKASFL